MKKILMCSMLAFSLLSPSLASAHSPILDCFDNGDGTITCEGGFSDGSSASGVKLSILDASGTLLMQGKMNNDSEYTFKKPGGAYKVVFDAGDGHNVEVDGAKIVQ